MTTSMRRRTRRFLLIAALGAAVVAWPSLVSADTGGGGETDLGLDGLTITSATVVPKTGLVTISGEIACSQDLHAGVWVELTQVVGRLSSIHGGNGTDVECAAADGVAGFSFEFYPWDGKFAPGRARLSAYAETGSCTEEECFFDSVSLENANIRLTR